MLAARVALRRVPTSAQSMSRSHHADPTIPEQRLRTHLRSGRLVYHASLQVDAAFTKRSAVLVWLLHEAQPHARRLGGDAIEDAGPESLHEPLARPQRKRSNELLDIELRGGAQHCVRVLYELSDGAAKLECARRGNEASPSPDQQWIARRLPQARQRSAHR